MNKPNSDRYSEEETIRRRDETIKRMIATPPKKHKDENHRQREPQPKPGKRGA